MYDPTTAPPATVLPPHPEEVPGDHPLLAESSSPTFLTTASKMQLESTAAQSNAKMHSDPKLLLEHHDPATPSSEYAVHSPASRMQPNRLPAALPDHASSLLLQDSEVDAFQRHTTGLYLDRLPSSSTTNKKDATVLSHSRLDSVPEVFGEMPTRRSGYDYCSRHHTTTLSTCVPYRSINLSEKNLDGMPQSYGFDNLSRQTIILADGTEHSYYALPETSPLERATRDPVFDAYEDETDGSSTEFVDVFVGIPGQQKYEDQLEGEQLLKCVSKAPETEQTSKYLRKASENKTHSSRSPMSAIATDLMQFRAFERLPVFDVDDNKTGGCSCVFVEVFIGTPQQQIYEENEKESEHPTKCLGKMKITPERPTISAFSDHAAKSTSTHVRYLRVDKSIECYKMNNKTKLNLLPDYELGGTMGEAQQFATRPWMRLSTEAGQQEWDHGIGTPSSLDRWLYWLQDTKFIEIALWLITFNPP